MEKEEKFDEAMRRSQHGDPLWQVRREAEYLMDFIDRQRAQSHIVSRYQLSMDVLYLIVSEEAAKCEDDRNEEMFEDALAIRDIVNLLRTESLGPSSYWKMEAYFC